jgi:hypothetical protein
MALHTSATSPRLVCLSSSRPSGGCLQDYGLPNDADGQQTRRTGTDSAITVLRHLLRMLCAACVSQTDAQRAVLAELPSAKPVGCCVRRRAIRLDPSEPVVRRRVGPSDDARVGVGCAATVRSEEGAAGRAHSLNSGFHNQRFVCELAFMRVSAPHSGCTTSAAWTPLLPMSGDSSSRNRRGSNRGAGVWGLDRSPDRVHQLGRTSKSSRNCCAIARWPKRATFWPVWATKTGRKAKRTDSLAQMGHLLAHLGQNDRRQHESV